MIVNLINAVLFAVAGFSLGLREIILSPPSSPLPAAPLIVRTAMFLKAAMLAGVAMVFAGRAQDQDYAGDAAPIVIILGAIMAFHGVVMLLDVMRRRYAATFGHVNSWLSFGHPQTVEIGRPEVIRIHRERY